MPRTAPGRIKCTYKDTYTDTHAYMRNSAEKNKAYKDGLTESD